MSVLRCAFVTALILLPIEATAQPEISAAPRPAAELEAGPRAEPEVEAAKPSISPGTLPILAAFVPGLLVHGAGHYVAGDKKTAGNLLKWQGIGLALGVASALFLRYSGGSRYANELTIPMAVSGSGILINTFVADLYGSAGGGNNNRYQARAKQAATLGYAYIHDPQFSYRHFTRASARLKVQSFQIEPLLWTAMDDNNQRVRVPVQYRFLDNQQGDYLEATSAFTYHNFGSEKFATYVGELSMGGRIEMQRLGHSLRGSFTTMSVGAGLQTTRYKVDGIGSDRLALLLGHFGYGFYLPKSGELEAYYQHRRDTFTGGTSPSARNGSGFLGHFGLQLRQPIHKRFAIHAQAEIGSAYLLTSGLEVQWGQY